MYSELNNFQINRFLLRITNYVTLLLSAFLVLSCLENVSSSEKTGEGNPTYDQNEWLIPADQVLRGAGRDQIPSIDKPSFQSISKIDFMKDKDLVLGFKVGDEVRAYPHKVLNYHEIVNDEIKGIPVCVTFCPLTGSGLAWKRIVANDTTTFGVSGLIYKNNLVAYDRKTESRWSQMLVQSVNGPQKERRPPKIYHRMIEMDWESWKKAYPESKILNGTKIKSAFYGKYPYGEDYPSDNEHIIFPIEQEDDRLEKKTLVHGLFYNSSSIVFAVDDFPTKTKVINDQFLNKKVVVVGNSEYQFVKSYLRILEDGTELTFSATDKELPIIMKDQEGNYWNIFGEAVVGPREGTQLQTIPAYNAYWFAWVDFFKQSPKTPRIYRHSGPSVSADNLYN